MDNFIVKVPATSANLGPGYDVIGIAFNVYNEFSFSFKEKEKLKISIRGEGEGILLENENNLAYIAFLEAFRHCSEPVPNIFLKQKNSIPLNRGMGSSATAVLGGLIAAREILKDKLPQHIMLDIAINLEGHPDNLMAAFMGGVVLNYKDENKYWGVNFMPPIPLKAVLVVPEIQISTKKAREILPQNYSTKDVVFNLQNISLLVYSLKSGNYNLLRRAMRDMIHQPYRSHLIEGFSEVCKAAQKENSLGEAVSGSGSTILSLCRENEKEIGESMVKAFKKFGVSSRYIITSISSKGAHIV